MVFDNPPDSVTLEPDGKTMVDASVRSITG